MPSPTLYSISDAVDLQQIAWHACAGLQQGAHAEEGYCIQAQAQSNFHLSARLINVQSGTPIDPLYADVTFSAGGHDFELHKAVMAPASLVFERMLSSGMQEGATYSPTPSAAHT